MNDRPLIVAHRGASTEAPENTLPAFRLAWEQQADAIEGDFRITRDGHIVCIHDPDTLRISGKLLRVADTDLRELQQLDVGAHKNHRFAGTGIPTLDEVLATVPAGRKIYLEIKCGPEIIEPLFQSLENSSAALDQAVVISFDAEVIRAVKDRQSAIRAYWLYSLGKAGSQKSGPELQTILNTLDRCRADGISFGRRKLTQEAVLRVVQEGYEFHVWTVDHPADARRFAAWGAGSITTNFPGKIIEPKKCSCQVCRRYKI